MTFVAFKENVYIALNNPEPDRLSARIAHFLIIVLITMSLAIVVIESVERFHHQYGRLLDFAESIILIGFATEYALRVWSSTINPKYRHPFLGRLRFALTFLALADLVAILPIIAPEWISVNLTFIRSARLLAILGIVNVGRRSRAMELLIQVLKSKRHEIAASFIIVGIMILCSSILMYYVEGPQAPFNSIPSCFWWAIATVTTVGGYSHIFPSTMAGRFCAVIISFLGITALAFPSGIIVAGILEKSSKIQRLCSRCQKALEEEKAEVSKIQ